MRRLILEDPLSRAAIWSRNLAVFALVVALLGVGLARQGLDPKTSLAIEGSALAISALGVLCALVAMIVIWHKGYRGLGLALGGLALSGLLYVYPAYVVVQARGVPSLVDVSTSPDDPPAFATSAKATAARHGVVLPVGPNPVDKASQATLYPDLQTVTLDVDPEEAQKIVQKIIKRRKWVVIDSVDPVNFATGHIDAVVKTALMELSRRCDDPHQGDRRQDAGGHPLRRPHRMAGEARLERRPRAGARRRDRRSKPRELIRTRASGS